VKFFARKLVLVNMINAAAGQSYFESAAKSNPDARAGPDSQEQTEKQRLCGSF
jgi:hypothetical protein